MVLQNDESLKQANQELAKASQAKKCAESKLEESLQVNDDQRKKYNELEKQLDQV